MLYLQWLKLEFAYFDLKVKRTEILYSISIFEILEYIGGIWLSEMSVQRTKILLIWQEILTFLLEQKKKERWIKK